MFKGLKTMLGSETPGHDVRPNVNGKGSSDKNKSGEPLRHNSPGLDQLTASLKAQSGLSILDLAGASQANLTFIMNQGHRPSADDMLHALDSAFGRGPDFFANQAIAEKVDQFMSQSLDFGEEKFDAALVWDTLQFLAPPLLRQTVSQLHHVLRPGASLLAFFNADEKRTTIPSYSYRIVDAKTIALVPKGAPRPAQYFNNRAIEKMFAEFRSVKFFLTRDHLREVIVLR